MPTELKGRSTPAAVAGKNGYSLISSRKFRQLYAALLKCELLEERLGSFPAHGADGTENLMAAAVALMLDLSSEDTAVLTPRIFAANLVKGVPAHTLLSHTNVSGSGSAFACGKVSVLTPKSSSAATQAGIATGAALANKMAKNGKISVGFMEGGATTLRECKEALELASRHKLPVLYVVQMELDRGDEKLLRKLNEMFPVISVDGNDLVAIYRVAQESIARARDGGPTLIACVPCAAEGMSASPIASMERYLTGKKLFDYKWKDEALAEFNAELGSACLPQSDPLA